MHGMAEQTVQGYSSMKYCSKSPEWKMHMWPYLILNFGTITIH